MYSKNDYRNYLIHRLEESDDYLAHYGVKGMKWKDHQYVIDPRLRERMARGLGTGGMFRRNPVTGVNSRVNALKRRAIRSGGSRMLRSKTGRKVLVGLGKHKVKRMVTPSISKRAQRGFNRATRNMRSDVNRVKRNAKSDFNRATRNMRSDANRMKKRVDKGLKRAKRKAIGVGVGVGVGVAGGVAGYKISKKVKKAKTNLQRKATNTKTKAAIKGGASYAVARTKATQAARKAKGRLESTNAYKKVNKAVSSRTKSSNTPSSSQVSRPTSIQEHTTAKSETRALRSNPSQPVKVKPTRQSSNSARSETNSIKRKSSNRTKAQQSEYLRRKSGETSRNTDNKAYDTINNARAENSNLKKKTRKKSRSQVQRLDRIR